MPDAQPKFQTFEEFWPYYLSQHSKRATRRLHIGGTFLSLAMLFKALVTVSILWLVGALLVGYGTAWVGHAYIEKNQPATFENVGWSLRGDLVMTWMWATGKLEAELVRHNITT